MDDIKVAGIGRIKITPRDVKTSDIIIPTLHFLVAESDDGYDSTCLELALSSYGKTESESIDNLMSYINTYITELMNMGEDGRKQIIETVEDNSMENYWQIYRKINFKLGMKGISTEITDKLLNEITFIKKRLEYLEKVRALLILGGNPTESKGKTYKVEEEYERIIA